MSLSEVEAMNRLPLDGVSGAWEWDPAGARLFADARFAALYGLDAAELATGVPTARFFARIHAEDRPRIRIAVAGVLRGSTAFDKEYRVQGADGLLRWVCARGRAEHDDGGALLRFSGVLTDISEQKRLEEQLRVAQTAGGVGTFEYVEGFGTASVSEQFCRQLGLQATDTLPVRTINAVVHADDPVLIRPLQDTDAATRYDELRIRRADTGEERWIACRGEARPDADTGGARFIGVVYDITDSKEIEAQLRELAAELEHRVHLRTRERDQVWRLSRDLIAVLGADGVRRAVNPAWERLTGWSEAELVGAPFLDIVHPDDVAKAQAELDRLQSGQAVESAEWRIRARGGAERWINWTLVPHGDEVYATGRDFTERKQLEEQLRQSQKMEAVGQLTGGLAHDLNNMLTGVIGGMDFLMRRLEAGRTEEAVRFVGTAMASAQRAASLTQRLLAFSRRQSLMTGPVDVNVLVRSMEELLRRTLGEQVDLVADYGVDLWRALSDPGQLESAVLNLAINARDAMAGGGRLTIETANAVIDTHVGQGVEGLAPGDYVLVAVSDTGSGMSAATRAKVFEPFFTTKPIGQGTGLGLSMVYGFVRQTGGHVAIHSQEGLGTSVKLYLPRAHAELAAQPEKRKEAPKGAGETVLLVEDDAAVRMLVLEVLNDLGYRAVEAVDADQALKVVQTGGSIDLLVTDVGLPGLNGRQLAELARESRPDLPVLFITGYAAAAAARADFLDPGMDMIAKPFSLAELGRKIRTMIEA